MNRLVLFSTLALATLTGACSGGVGGPPPPPPAGNFSAASLKGSYTFQMSGTDINGNSISRVGSFNADGMGNITAGIEDVNDGFTVNFAGPSTPVVFDAAPQSTYTVLSNGRGTLTLHDSSGALTFSITLSSTSAGLMSAGLMVETDGNATCSGSFRAQTVTTTFSPAYAFDFSGVDSGGVGLSLVGQFTTNTTNIINGGMFDENDGGSLAPQTPISPTAITLDAANSAFGRGQAVMNGRTFEFYVVDGSNLAVLEEDGSGLTSGFATAQNAVPTQVGGIAGSFVFDVGGSASTSTFTGPLARAGRFDANGGAISNLFLDENFSTAASTFGGAGTGAISNVTFTIDPAGSGRGTLGFTDVASGNVFSYVFYLTSATGGFIQDTSSGGVVGDGSLFLQSGTFTAASLAGNFIANWSGVNARNGFEEDFNSQFALTSATSNNITGVVDYTELGNTSNQVVTGAGVAGTFTLTGTGTGGGSTANTVSLQAGGQAFNFHAYLINNNSILLIGTDSNHVVLGSVARQP